ncbi:MAG: hypothetical protein M1833_005568 [Piccolia ochrophora]|nr:MAG: hypothetical protein M1833_005568 [Piccolia ochrophora]
MPKQLYRITTTVLSQKDGTRIRNQSRKRMWGHKPVFLLFPIYFNSQISLLVISTASIVDNQIFNVDIGSAYQLNTKYPLDTNNFDICNV